MTIPSGHCERARVWASLHVDGELSELEQALLAAHVGRCEECRAFAAGIGGVEELIRSAPTERPARPIEVRRLRSSRSLRLLQAAAAVAIVATAGLGAIVADVFHETSVESAAPDVRRVSAVANQLPEPMPDQRRLELDVNGIRLATWHPLLLP